MSILFELEDLNTQEAKIKVIGVGGCGGNAVDHMIAKGMGGVEFITINTDSQALKRNRASTQLQIGNSATKGLGAGGKWEVGREAALEDKERIANLIDGADMLFIAAGMGGGTGTGAAPVVAEVAKDLGILSVAVVTKPFKFEQAKRERSAEQGLKALAEQVDSLIVIPNEKLIQVLGPKTKLNDAFIAANDVLHGAVSGIAEIIKSPGLINVDFADVKAVMGEVGMAMMGSAVATGEGRARQAAEAAVASPLLENVDLKGAKGMLVNITADDSLTLEEYYEVMNIVQGFATEEATVIVGTALDSAMGEGLRVTMVATGLGNPNKAAAKKPEMRIVEPVMLATGTDNARPYASAYDPADIDTPTVFRNRRAGAPMAVEPQGASNVDSLDIPAFLRKQAD